jgi:hypothetical protein
VVNALKYNGVKLVLDDEDGGSNPWPLS